MQGKTTPNIGQYGIGSIRLRGMKIDDLPIAEAARVKAQMPQVEADAYQQLINNIKARYPSQDCAYLESRIREARGSIGKFREQAIKLGAQREEYRMLLRDAKKRDRKIRKLPESLPETDRQSRIRELNDEYGPWQRKGLESQIGTFGESIKRFEDAAKKEQSSIDEMVELLGQCRARDKELTRIGA